MTKAVDGVSEGLDPDSESLDPTTLELPLRLVALQAYQSEQYDTCRDLLEQMKRLNPDDPGLAVFEQCQIARRHSLDGEHFKAMEVLGKAVPLDPTSELTAFCFLKAALFAGERLARDGNVFEGLPFLEAALSVQPDHDLAKRVIVNCWNILAFEHLSKGDTAKALSYFRQGLDNLGGAVEPLKALSFCMSQPVSAEFIMHYRFVLLSLLHHHDLDAASVEGVGMGAGVLKQVAAQANTLGERTLEAAALGLQMLIWGVEPDAHERLSKLGTILPNAALRLRRQVFLSDRYTVCYSPFVGHHGRPSGPYGVTSQFLDRDGFPNPEPPRMPKTEKCRIFVLGDSTIFHGDGSMETAIPARMQDRLHDRGLIGARVYNYGIPGCTFHQPMALMHSLLLDYEPDLIVINIGGVDSVIHKNHDPRPGYPMWGFMFQLAQEHCQRTSADADYSTRDNWERLASDWLDLGRIAGNDMEDAYIGRVADEFKIALNRIGRFADAYGLPTLLTLQPIAHTRVNPPASESGMANPNAMDIIRRQYHAFKKVAFPDGQREVQWSRNLKVVDITDVFDPCDGRIYTDHVHYNSTGRDMMTRRFIELLEPYLASFRCEVASSLEEINIGASVQTLRRAVH